MRRMLNGRRSTPLETRVPTRRGYWPHRLASLDLALLASAAFAASDKDEQGVSVAANVPRAAFSATLALNNHSPADTSRLRAIASIEHGNLWNAGHYAALMAYTAPGDADDGTVFYGAYMLPVAQKTQLLGYYVYSDSDVAVLGGTSVVGKGELGGLRLYHSLGWREDFYHTLIVGADWKRFTEEVLLGSNGFARTRRYVPVSLAWRGDWTSEHRQSDLALTFVAGTDGEDFTAWRLDGSHTQDIGRGFQLHAHAIGQWSPDALLSNEGFGAGGMETVRGYHEWERIGDYGAVAQFELRTADLAAVLVAGMDELRFHCFADAAWAGLRHADTGHDRRFGLASTGIGARMRIARKLGAGIDVGVPLKSGTRTDKDGLFGRVNLVLSF